MKNQKSTSELNKIIVCMRAQSLSCVQPFVTPYDSPGKNTGVGCHFLLQRIFPIQESNTHLLEKIIANEATKY